jgi:hypothetical protein
VVHLALGIGILLFSARFAAAQPCVPDAQKLCLNNDRFEVSVKFRTADSGETFATGVELTPDSGYFWFFNPANIEVVVKVLNACSLNPPAYWVFATGLTNVEVTIFVFDKQTEEFQVYINPLFTPFAPIQDTSAFDTCP